MKATQDDYEPLTMEELEVAALRVLADIGPARCGLIGEQLFRDAHHRGTAPFAGIAGWIMRRLKTNGYAKEKLIHGWLCWQITDQGRALL